MAIFYLIFLLTSFMLYFCIFSIEDATKIYSLTKDIVLTPSKFADKVVY